MKGGFDITFDPQHWSRPTSDGVSHLGMLLSDDHRGATTGDRWQHNTTAARQRRQCSNLTYAEDEKRISLNTYAASLCHHT